MLILLKSHLSIFYKTFVFHIYFVNQHSVGYLRGTICVSPKFSLCVAPSSSVSCPADSSHVGLPRLILSAQGVLWAPKGALHCHLEILKAVSRGSLQIRLICFPSFGEYSFVAWCPVSPQLLFHIFCPVFLIVLVKSLDLVPTTLTWPEAEVFPHLVHLFLGTLYFLLLLMISFKNCWPIKVQFVFCSFAIQLPCSTLF